MCVQSVQWWFSGECRPGWTLCTMSTIIWHTSKHFIGQYLCGGAMDGYKHFCMPNKVDVSTFAIQLKLWVAFRTGCKHFCSESLIVHCMYSQTLCIGTKNSILEKWSASTFAIQLFKYRNFFKYFCNFLDQLLHPYKFYGRDMSGILFFIFDSCHPLSVHMLHDRTYT